jgi:hypothetical protein
MRKQANDRYASPRELLGKLLELERGAESAPTKPTVARTRRRRR